MPSRDRLGISVLCTTANLRGLCPSRGLAVSMNPHRNDIKAVALPLIAEQLQVSPVVGIGVRVEHEGSAAQVWRNLLEQLQRLADYRVVHIAEAGDIAARMCNARYESLYDWVVDDDENQRD